MRVLFDAYWWTKGPTANRTVLREFVFAWERLFPDDQIILALRARDADVSGLPKRASSVRTHLYPHALSNAVELGAIARRVEAQAVVSHNYAPIFGPSLVFIHDLLFEENPQWFTRIERLYFGGMSHLARRARVVATSSRTEAVRIERLHPYLAPVVATGLGVASSLARSSPGRPALPDFVKSFTLSVGRLNARKNLDTTIRGAMGSSSVTPSSPLVVVGSAEYSGVGAHLPRDVADFVSDGRLIFLGYVNDAELRWLYENTAALIFMSLDEGYGLPILEARYFGAHIIASDIDVMREVAGPEAVLVPPYSAARLSAAIDDAIRNPPNDNNLDLVPDPWGDAVGVMRRSLIDRVVNSGAKSS